MKKIYVNDVYQASEAKELSNEIHNNIINIFDKFIGIYSIQDIQSEIFNSICYHASVGHLRAGLTSDKTERSNNKEVNND